VNRIYLGGTTTGTSWRQELSGRMMQRGVAAERITNPQLIEGGTYTSEHREIERNYKRDPSTIVLMYFCPAAEEAGLTAKAQLDKSEYLSLTSVFDAAKFAYSQPHRTAVVFDYEFFTLGRGPRLALQALADELREDFGGRPPYFSSLDEAEDWSVERLIHKPA